MSLCLVYWEMVNSENPGKKVIVVKIDLFSWDTDMILCNICLVLWKMMDGALLYLQQTDRRVLTMDLLNKVF